MTKLVTMSMINNHNILLDEFSILLIQKIRTKILKLMVTKK